MSHIDRLQQLTVNKNVEGLLKRGSEAAGFVRGLQVLLFELGYGSALSWEKYRADGDYGRGTTQAVLAYVKQHGLDGDGTEVNKDLLLHMLRHHQLVVPLQSLAQAVAANEVDRHFHRDATPARIFDLQQLLQAADLLKIGGRNGAKQGKWGPLTQAAIKQLTQSAGSSPSVQKLNNAAGKALLDKLRPGFGPDFGKIDSSQALGRQRDFVAEDHGGKWFVYDDRVSVTFRPASLGSFRGHFHSGSERADIFLKTYRSVVDRVGALTPSAFRVMMPVSENEGKLDAINTYDNSFLSFGMYQWTAGQGGNEGELAALVQRIKTANPEAFQSHFGRHGLDVVDVDKGPVYGYFSLNGTRLDSAAAKEQLRKPEWAFRFWRAGIDPAVQLIEVLHALDRLKTFYQNDRYLVDNKYYVADLISSEFGVALLLDNHVNRPAYPRIQLAMAMEQTGLRNTPPKNWHTEEERKLLNAYLKIRQEHPSNPKKRMTHAAKREAVTRTYLERGELSGERGSFDWGHTPGDGSRSLDMDSGLGFDYPIIREEETA